MQLCPAFVRVFGAAIAHLSTLPTCFQFFEMGNFKISISLVGLFILVFACQNRQQKPIVSLPFSKDKITKLSPQSLFETAKILDNPLLVDSIFKIAIQAAEQQAQHQTCLEHLQFYQSLRGGEPAVRAFVLLTHGKIHQMGSRLDSAQLLFSQALELSKKEKLPLEEANSLESLGEIQHLRGEYANSAKHFQEAKKLFQQLGNLTAVQIIVLREAENFSRNDQFELALSHAQTAVPFFEKQKDSAHLASVYNIIAINLKFLSQPDSSIFWHQKAFEIRKARGDRSGMGESLNNLAAVEIWKKNYSAAIETIQQAIEIYESSDNRIGLGMLHSNLGFCHQQLQNFAAAESEFLKAREILRDAKQFHAQTFNLDRLAVLERRQNKHREALQYFLESRALRDSIVLNQREEFRNKLAAAQNESRLAQLAIRQKNLNLTIGLSAAAALVLVLSLLFWFFRLRQKQKILAQEAQLIDFQEKEKLKDLEMARLELAIQQHQLDETTTELASKNTLLQELSDILEQYRRHDQPLTATRGAQAALTSLFGLQILTNDDWKNFRERFEQTHPGFIRDLKKQFPEVSDAELRLILLIKMGVRSRDVAQMLGIASDSVSKTRHRLRKKLGLIEADKLEDFIENYRRI